MKIVKTISFERLKKFLSQIKEKDFIKIAKINNETWRNYRSKKKFFYYFVLDKEKEYVASMVVLKTSYSNHLYFLYVLKSHRGTGLGTKLLKKFFLIDKRKMKTVHIKKLKELLDITLKTILQIN